MISNDIFSILHAAMLTTKNYVQTMLTNYHIYKATKKTSASLKSLNN